jgi:hypothetical protein
MPNARVPTWALVSASAPLVVAALAMTAQSTALAGDGAYFLVQILSDGDVYSMTTRYFGNAVRQAPVLAGVAAGITDTQTLAMLLGVGQLVLPALIWASCVLLTREDRVAFTAVVIAAGICTGTTWALSVSENVLAVSLTALVAVLLWLPRSWAWSHIALGVAAGVVLIATYEAALITGLILAVWACVRAVRTELRRERWATALTAFLSLASVGFSTQGFWNEASPEHSRSVVYAVVSLEPWSLYLSIVGLVAFVLGIGLSLAQSTRTPLLVAGTGAMAVALAGFEVSTTGALAARGGASIAVVVLQILLLWLWSRRRDSSESSVPIDTRLLAVPVGYLILILAANVWALRSWNESLSTFRSEVDGTRGVVFAEDVIPPDRREVLWYWTSSSLSIIVRSDPSAGVLVDRGPLFVPFQPEEAPEQISDKYSWGG